MNILAALMVFNEMMSDPVIPISRTPPARSQMPRVFFLSKGEAYHFKGSETGYMAPRGSDGLLSTHSLLPSPLYIHVEARFPCSVFEQRTSWPRHVLVVSISTLRLMYVVEE